MSVTEKLFGPLLRQPARPLITQYDDGIGSRIELSVATVANWSAKTANWLRDECDVEPGSDVTVLLPAHWQTVGVLLGAWWCGARITDDPAGAQVAFVTPGVEVRGADTVAVVSLDPLGRGLATAPTDGSLDYLNEIRVHGDDFRPWQPVPGTAHALLSSTVDELVAAAHDRATTLGIEAGTRALSTLDWTLPDGVLSGLLAVLAAGASLVQCGGPADPGKLAERRLAERTTVDLG
ncbi:MAG TPA: TIGR03089 family protein [Pseudonocardiaceae bacterium]|nr:TIGR03089 family protein [Pseudonocardiaceae bacterium]